MAKCSQVFLFSDWLFSQHRQVVTKGLRAIQRTEFTVYLASSRILIFDCKLELNR